MIVTVLWVQSGRTTNFTVICIEVAKFPLCRKSIHCFKLSIKWFYSSMQDNGADLIEGGLGRLKGAGTSTLYSEGEVPHVLSR